MSENKVQRITTRVNDEENELEQDWADIQSLRNYQLARNKWGKRDKGPLKPIIMSLTHTMTGGYMSYMIQCLNSFL